ncbi:MAG: hypothetical protein R2729_30640 [Bryobacteraceae bacterium]
MNDDLSFELKLLLYHAVINGGEFTKSAAGVKVQNPVIAETILNRGLLAHRKKGNAVYLSANDATWGWVEAHLGDEAAARTKTPVRTVLDGLRFKLHAYMQTTGTRLAEILQPRPAEPEPEPEPMVAELDRWERVRQACLDLTGGQYEVRVRLRDLRPRLDPWSRQDQDEALLGMQQSGQLVLYANDDPMDRDASDDAAALMLGDRRRDLVYLHREATS